MHPDLAWVRGRGRSEQSAGASVQANAYRLHPTDPPDDPKPRRGGVDPSGAGEGEDLAYRVELWDSGGEYVEQVVAVTSSPSIGYAAYYAATREFPECVITLRHKKSVMSKWSGKPH